MGGVHGGSGTPAACAPVSPALSLRVSPRSGGLLMNRGASLVPAAVAASLQFSQVIFGHLIGITLLREPVTLGGALGLVPVGAGVGAVARA